jgi:hypothetical protein
LTSAIAKIEEMQAADPADANLTDLLSALRGRSEFITGHSTGPAPSTSFARDILHCSGPSISNT